MGNDLGKYFQELLRRFKQYFTGFSYQEKNNVLFNLILHVLSVQIINDTLGGFENKLCSGLKMLF